MISQSPSLWDCGCEVVGWLAKGNVMIPLSYAGRSYTHGRFNLARQVGGYARDWQPHPIKKNLSLKHPTRNLQHIDYQGPSNSLNDVAVKAKRKLLLWNWEPWAWAPRQRQELGSGALQTDRAGGIGIALVTQRWYWIDHLLHRENPLPYQKILSDCRGCKEERPPQVQQEEDFRGRTSGPKP